ncbi:MAG: hypothetical protein ACE5Z5_00290 [Candidatus Bathyarchaeia archaeon]
MGLEEGIIGVLMETGDMGATASQIARRLGRKREVISHYLWILKKAGRVINRGRNVWVLVSEGLDPFDMPLTEFEELSFEEYSSMAERAYELCKEKIKETFGDENVYHVVVCKGEVVYKSDDVAGVDSRVIKGLIAKMDSPCYVFSREDMVEETRWTRLNDDYYPTIELNLGGKEWVDEDVVDRGREVLADFDTGNPYYIIFNEEISENIVPSPSPYETHRGVHLGEPYWYFPKEVKISVKDVEGAFRCKVMRVRFVRLWEKSPLLLANPKREGFVGRNLMLTFNFKITLDPLTHISTVNY